MNMDKYAYYILLILFFTLEKSFADAEQDYKVLCSYDQKWCGKIKNSDGTWVKPKKEIVKLLKELGPIIQKHAHTLGVDPQAIAGAIMAENSLNVSISDDVQDLLVKIGVANKGEVLGKKFTYGLGQLNFEAARQAENHAAKLEGRAPIGDKELSDALLIPEKAIYFVAAVLRKCQDDYKDQGIDIASKPEILTTLYNLGYSETKALELKKSKSIPRPNYFGFFVKKYQSELSFLKSEPKAVAMTAKTSSKIIAAKKVEAIIAPLSPKIETETKVLKLAFTKSMPLYSAPPTCGAKNDYGATDLRTKYDAMKIYTVSAIADKEKSFQVIAPSIDCEANTWELIKLSSGEQGWIKKDDLDKNTAKLLITKLKCTPKVDLKCVADFKENMKKNIISDADNSKGEIFVSPFTKGKKATFKNPDWQCSSRDDDGVANPPSGNTMGANPFGISYGSGGGGYGYPGINPTVRKIGKPINSDDALKESLARIDQKEKAIEAYYKLPLVDPVNPYNDLPFRVLKDGLQKCANKQIYKLDVCQLDLSQVDKLMNAIELKPKPSRDDKGFLAYNMQMLPLGMPLPTKDQYIAMIKSNPFGSGAYYPMGGMGFGSYGMGGLNAQYAFHEGDEKLWNIEDVESALKECDTSFSELLSKINSSTKLGQPEIAAMSAKTSDLKNYFLKSAKDALDTIKAKSKEQKEKLWTETQAEFVQASKFCLALADNFDLKTKKNFDQPALQNYNCFYQNLKILEDGPSLMLKELVQESMFSMQGLQLLEGQASYALSAMKLLGLGLIPNPYGVAAPVTALVPVEVPPSYCPNKTAEIIEEMVKSYPCISKVYIPDKWLLNRLNELGDKVIFRPFADDDRYSFDLESKQCK